MTDDPDLTAVLHAARALAPGREVLRVVAFVDGLWLVQVGELDGRRDFALSLGFRLDDGRPRLVERLLPCPTCNTRGRTDDGPCPGCARRGWRTEAGLPPQDRAEIRKIWRLIPPDDPDQRTAWERGP